MGVLINHSIAFVTSPIAVGLTLAFVGAMLVLRGRNRLGAWITIAGAGWITIFSTAWMYGLLAMPLEREFPPERVESVSSADAIVVLGGGITGNTNVCPYAELEMAGDRVAQAARLWRAGKAPVIIPSGKGETEATLPFLMEMGVPKSAVMVENESRNTEENARFVSGLGYRRILLVTSVWHMRRSLLLFRKYAPQLEVIPSACDYEATVHSDKPFELAQLLPNADSLLRCSYMLKEHIGYWGYRLFR